MKDTSPSPEAKKDLKSMALNIEFLVISVIQGMALQMLAASAIPVFTMGKIEYWPYAITGFVLILVFWSQSIIHALSFIDWPINLTHTFLYFLASFIEVITFSHITNPLEWFIFGLGFVIIVGILYVYDFFMIRNHKKNLQHSDSSIRLYKHIHSIHFFEMTILVPSAILFNTFAIWALYTYPDFFIHTHHHAIIATIQALFSIILLVISVYAFKNRSGLITDTFAHS